MSCFKIGSREIGAENLFFMIEEGQANLGDYRRAILMIDAAVSTGADAIEFQLARAKDFYVKDDPGFELYLKREFTDLQLRDLIRYTKGKGMEFIATPLSHKIVMPLAKAGCSGFNINASDLTNPDIIDSVLDSGLPFFLSIPLAAEEEISWAINRITKRGILNYGILHGQHTMEKGLSVEHTSLGYIRELKERYQLPVGFIDHTPLMWMPAAAVAAGSEIVSKHLALLRNDRGPDWQVCLEPDEMKVAVNWAKKMRESLKADFKKLAPGEALDKTKMRRSIVAAKKLEAGKILKREDLAFKRPGTGFCPSSFEKIIGQILLREIQPDEQINLSDIKEV